MKCKLIGVRDAFVSFALIMKRKIKCRKYGDSTISRHVPTMQDYNTCQDSVTCASELSFLLTQVQMQVQTKRALEALTRLILLAPAS